MGPAQQNLEQQVVIPWTWSLLWTNEQATLVTAIFTDKRPHIYNSQYICLNT